MINKLGIFTLLVLLTAPFMVVEHFFGGKFIGNFLNNQSLQIMGTLLALNIATASFLVGNLVDIEIRERKNIFDSTVREIKHNVYFMIVIFILHMIVLMVSDSDICVNSQDWGYWLKGGALLLFFVYLFCLYEITAAVFSVRKHLKQ